MTQKESSNLVRKALFLIAEKGDDRELPHEEDLSLSLEELRSQN